MCPQELSVSHKLKLIQNTFVKSTSSIVAVPAARCMLWHPFFTWHGSTTFSWQPKNRKDYPCLYALNKILARDTRTKRYYLQEASTDPANRYTMCIITVTRAHGMMMEAQYYFVSPAMHPLPLHTQYPLSYLLV